jgi:hypothetical protein
MSKCGVQSRRCMYLDHLIAEGFLVPLTEPRLLATYSTASSRTPLREAVGRCRGPSGWFTASVHAARTRSWAMAAGARGTNVRPWRYQALGGLRIRARRLLWAMGLISVAALFAALLTIGQPDPGAEHGRTGLLSRGPLLDPDGTGRPPPPWLLSEPSSAGSCRTQGALAAARSGAWRSLLVKVSSTSSREQTCALKPRAPSVCREGTVLIPGDTTRWPSHRRGDREQIAAVTEQRSDPVFLAERAKPRHQHCLDPRWSRWCGGYKTGPI